MMVADCIACRHGNHASHVEWPKRPPKGMMGGHKCECKGECETYITMQGKGPLPESVLEAALASLSELD